MIKIGTFLVTLLLFSFVNGQQFDNKIKFDSKIKRNIRIVDKARRVEIKYTAFKQGHEVCVEAFINSTNTRIQYIGSGIYSCVHQYRWELEDIWLAMQNLYLLENKEK